MAADVAYDDMKVKYDRANMLRNSLQKNLDRRKKMNMGDDSYVRDLMNDIAKADEEVAYLRKKLRSMESQKIRSSNIDGNLENSFKIQSGYILTRRSKSKILKV